MTTVIDYILMGVCGLFGVMASMGLLKIISEFKKTHIDSEPANEPANEDIDLE
jgi:hypothetical protein